MKLIQILTGITLLSTLTLASKCEEFKNALEPSIYDSTIYDSIVNCTENGNGSIETLILKNSFSTVFGYNPIEIKNLVIEDDSNQYNRLRVNLMYFSRSSSLTLKHIAIDHYALTDISDMLFLKELNFVDCIDYDFFYYEQCKNNNIYEGDGCLEAYRYDLDWNKLTGLSFLRTLTIGDGIDVPTWFIRNCKNDIGIYMKLTINGKKPSYRISDCEDIENYLKRQGIKNEIECEEDKKGQVTSLKTSKLNSQYIDEQRIIDRLNSYPTLKSLEFYDEIEPSNETEPSNEMTCSKSKELGYECCSHCNCTFIDKDGLWGAENGKWCIIPDQCPKENDGCWSKVMGYPCCDHCKVHTEDKSGKWGVMNNDWCGIPLNC